MPRPSTDEQVYMLLLLVNELHEIAKDAIAARDRLSQMIVEDGRLDPDGELRLMQQAWELRQRVEVLGYSEIALRLAAESIH